MIFSGLDDFDKMGHSGKLSDLVQNVYPLFPRDVNVGKQNKKMKNYGNDKCSV